ncbi:MAG: outer membrane lipoprotein chaperone LolA [Halioglobus sp.]
MVTPMWVKRVALLLALLGSGIASAAESALDSLEQRLADMSQLSGTFVQRQYVEEGVEPILSSGRFRLLQPGYFAWDIQSPDSQLVIAGPEFIWHYDRDLETVTRRPVAGQPSLSPLQVLGGREGALAANYTVTAGAKDGEFILQPLTPDAGFNSLVLSFDGGAISRLTFTDNLGQRVEVDLAELDAQTPLTPADFAFTPPDGADLFFHDQ